MLRDWWYDGSYDMFCALNKRAFVLMGDTFTVTVSTFYFVSATAILVIESRNMHHPTGIDAGPKAESHDDGRTTRM